MTISAKEMFKINAILKELHFKLVQSKTRFLQNHKLNLKFKITICFAKSLEIFFSGRVGKNYLHLKRTVGRYTRMCHFVKCMAGMHGIVIYYINDKS